MNYDLRVLFLLFMLYSVIGWLTEVIGKLITDNKFIDRGFLIGPYCPIYGCGVISMILLLNKYLDDPFTLFIMCILLFSIWEYLTSYFMEKLFHARWWDYTKYKFNINGRICLETMIPFGLSGVFVMYIANPFFTNIINSLSSTYITMLSIFLFIIFVTDIILSSNAMFKIKGTIKKLKKDNTEEITSRVKELILQKNYFKKRIIKAFPKLKIK